VFGKKAGSVINLYFVFSLCVWVLNRSFGCIYPLLRQALKRYMKCLADRFQLKFREGKTKRKKPTHIF